MYMIDKRLMPRVKVYVEKMESKGVEIDYVRVCVRVCDV
jgi:hypothetical protein